MIGITLFQSSTTGILHRLLNFIVEEANKHKDVRMH
jgi:hypothetical protein